MLTVLSPAKTLDFDSPLPTRKRSEPRLVGQSAALIEIMQTKSPADIAQLMHISDDLAHLNATRFAEFTLSQDQSNARAALLAFAGDVYQGLNAKSFNARDFTEAQKSLRILSGMYGLLRPMDLIQPHRLEMGTRLANSRGATLYDWWRTPVTELLSRDLTASPGPPVLINLASQEYFKVVDTERLGARVISPRFEDRDPSGEPRVVSFHAKRARGAMAAWLLRERVRSAARIVDFEGDGYVYDDTRSTRDQPIFVR